MTRAKTKDVEDLRREADRRLAELEAIIDKGLTTFIEVGLALQAIRDEKLYAIGHPGRTWTEYCRDRFGITASSAKHQIRLAAMANEGQRKTGVSFTKSQITAVDKASLAAGHRPGRGGRKQQDRLDKALAVAAEVVRDNPAASQDQILDEAEARGLNVSVDAGSPDRRNRKKAEAEKAAMAADPMLLARKFIADRKDIGTPVSRDEVLFIAGSLNQLLEPGLELELLIDNKEKS